MSSRIDRRLADLAIQLPEAPAPAANYVPWVRTGDLVFVSGQVPFEDGRLAYQGTVGADLTRAQGEAAARACALGVIAQVRAACGGDLDRVRRCVQIQGFVRSAPGFGEQPAVINAASNLMVDVFGDAGRHARFAVGTNELPFGVAVEIAAVFEIEG
ncbi:MAG: RidA family protein [Myxococcota bacterium]|nr:RidA family protein [Myxococcales bacterium]